jgi:dihydrodipicolinate synthase/N-acetylneuraminate lyase
VVRDLVHRREHTAHARVCELRNAFVGVPFHAALKATLADRGVLVHDDVRAPLRPLSDAERSRVRALR